ncbi:MAG: ATP-binding protein [Bacteroidales bacterium]
MVLGKKYILILILFLLSSYKLFAAPLIQENRTLNKEILLIEKNLELILQEPYQSSDSIKTLTLETLNLSKEINYSKGIINCYYQLGHYFQLRSQYDSALYYYLPGLEVAMINKSEMVTPFFVGIANIYWDTGDYSQGLEITFKVKQYLESEGLINSRYEVFNYAGLYFEGILEYSDALENFRKGLNIAIQSGQMGYAGIIFANMGRVYNKLMKYDSSIIYFKKGIALEIENKLIRNAGRSYSTLATVYANMNQMDLAKSYLEKAIELNNIAKDSTGLVRTYIAYGRFYNIQNDFKNSIRILNDAVPIALKFNNKSELVDIYNMLALGNNKLGNYQESNNFYSKYVEAYQQVFDIKKINQVSALENRLKITQKENEINLLKIEKQRSVTIYLLIITVLLLIISVSAIVFIVNYRRTNKKLISQNKKISEQNDNLEELNKQLILAEQNVSIADELKTNFINILSHEIRTPLNGIVGFSSLMVDVEISNQEKIEAANIIKKNSDELISTIEGLVDLSLINSNQLFIYKETFDIYFFMNNLKDDYLAIKNSLSKDQLSLTFVPDSRYSTFLIKTDNHLLKKILFKLLSNAIKFTNKGKIEYGFTISDGYIQFYILDTGIGIPKEYGDSIFNQFEKGKNIPKNSGGLGISLTLAKKYLELLNGKIWYDSVVNKGTKFYFELPIH